MLRVSSRRVKSFKGEWSSNVRFARCKGAVIYSNGDLNIDSPYDDFPATQGDSLTWYPLKLPSDFLNSIEQSTVNMILMRLVLLHSRLMSLTATLTLCNGKHMFESNLLYMYSFLQSVTYTYMHEVHFAIRHEKDTKTTSEDYVVR